MEFSPFNPIVQLCIQGMALEDAGKTAEALQIFEQALAKSENDFERFLAAHYIARNQTRDEEKLNWLQKSLQYALRSGSVSAQSALPTLYLNMALCFEKMDDRMNADNYFELAEEHRQHPSDPGPFYHGTKADLQTGDLLRAGGNSNYKSDFKMNHIYFTALPNGAGLAAALAKGTGDERVYIVEPTGPFENDPNLTDKKFPGNPTRSFRSESPLKVVGTIKEWLRPAPEELQRFRDKLENSEGEIVN